MDMIRVEILLLKGVCCIGRAGHSQPTSQPTNQLYLDHGNGTPWPTLSLWGFMQEVAHVNSSVSCKTSQEWTRNTTQYLKQCQPIAKNK